MTATGGERVVFRAGGSLDERHTYVCRPCDDALREALAAMEFCYVLAPRQIGKSSLWAHTARALEADGITAVTVDLQAMGSREVTLDAWYEALVTRVGRALRRGDEAAAVWARASLPAVERWSLFLREVVLADPSRRVVICLDEIDWVLSLPFRGDDLFASIRAAFNGRATDPAWRSLTFCLVGVASPDELIDDPGRTPFNVGRGVALEDFTRAECDALTPGLAGLGAEPAALMDAVFAWAEGHPFLTQRLCDALRRGGASGAEAQARVDAIVERTVPPGNPMGDPTFKSASDRLLHTGDARERLEALALWRRLLGGEAVEAQPTHPAQARLRLAGVAADRAVEGRRLLRARNRLVARVFDRAWVSAATGDRMLKDAVDRWNDSGRSDDFVLRGAALDEALAKTKERERTADEEAFLSASRAVRSRSQRRTTVAWSAALVALVATVGAVIAAIGFVRARSAQNRAMLQTFEAMRAEKNAERQRLAAEHARQESLETAAVALAQTQGQEVEALQNALLAYHGARARGAVGAALEDALITSVTRAAAWTPVSAHLGEVAGACFVRDDTRVVTAGEDGAVRLWDADDGSLAETVVAPGGAAWRAVACSPDGRWFAAGGADRTVRVWDAASTGHARTLQADGAVLDLAVTDGGLVVAATRAGRLHRWSPAMDAPAVVSYALGAATTAVRVSVSADGATALVTGTSGEPQRFDLTTMTAAPTTTWRNVSGVRVGRFMPGDPASRIMWGTTDGRLEVVPSAGPWTFRSIEFGASLRDLAFERAGRWFARVREDGWVGVGRVADLPTFAWRRSMPGRPQRVAWSSDGRRLVWSEEGGGIRLAPLRRPPWVERHGHEASVTAVAWCDGGATLVSGDRGGALRVWMGDGAQTALGSAWGRVRAIACVAMAPDGGVLVVTDAEVTLRARAGGAVVRALESALVSASAYAAADGARYAVVRDVGPENARVSTLEVVELASGARQRFVGFDGRVTALAFEEDGRRLLAAVAGGALVRWDGGATPLRRCDGVLSRVKALSVRGDEAALVGDDGWMQWVDLGRCEVLRTVRAHEGHALAVGAGDGLWFSAGDDGLVRRWNAERRLVGALWGGFARMNAVAVAGGRVAAGADDGVVRVWELGAEGYVREGCRLLARREAGRAVREACGATAAGASPAR